MNDWIDCSKELPPEDGNYEVTNMPNTEIFGATYYDGFGFIFDQKYVNPAFWRYLTKRTKKYGKIEENI